MIITPEQAYEYAKTHYPLFPNDWFVSPHFKWNDVFKNETKQDGLPELKIFQVALKASIEFEKIRVLLGKGMNVHCWYRSMAHNLRLKAQGLKPAMHSAHLYGMALDYDVTGMTPSQVRALLTLWLKQGKIKVRVEANTDGWVHCDIGSVYLNNYTWGVFNP
jgi:uncharacterized protein YcbK (DUF882 family)